MPSDRSFPFRFVPPGVIFASCALPVVFLAIRSEILKLPDARRNIRAVPESPACSEGQDKYRGRTERRNSRMKRSDQPPAVERLFPFVVRSRKFFVGREALARNR